MKGFQTTFGFPNAGWVYFIGLASLLEASILLFFYGSVLSDINRRLGTAGGNWRNQYNGPFRIMVFLLALSCVRILVAVALVAGRYRKTLSTLAFYIMFAVIGVAANIIGGILATNNWLTHDIGVVTISIIALHILFVLIAIKIYKQERETARDTRTGTVIPVSTAPTPFVPNSHHIPTLPASNNPYIQQLTMRDPHMPPPLSPPMYTEHEAGSTRHTVENEAATKQTTVMK